MTPYRQPDAPAKEAPVPRADLGAVRSLHRAPGLVRALLAPVLFPSIVFVLLALFQVPTLAALLVAVALTAVLFVHPLRMRGTVVTLHSEGVVVSRGDAVDSVAFEDVNEIWIEIGKLQSKEGGYLRALRLVDFDGQTHRFPLGVAGGVALAKVLFRECAVPLFKDARRALADGGTLRFTEDVQVTREGLRVRDDFAPWSELRFARIQPACVIFSKRRPFAWRTVKLDAIPNPTLFCALVLAHVKKVDQDGRWMVD